MIKVYSLFLSYRLSRHCRWRARRTTRRGAPTDAEMEAYCMETSKTAKVYAKFNFKKETVAEHDK